MERNSPNNSFQKISIFLGLLLLVSTSITAFPQKANAQFGGIVSDPITEAETTLNITQLAVLNPIAWTVAKAALQSVVKSSVNSINKGSNGTPGFVTNINQLMQSVGDTAANSFISQLSSNGSIKSPFQTAVASNVGNNYLQSTGSNGFFASNPYTLNKVASNDTGFLNGNFSQGGFTAFMSAWSNPANNPFGASQLAAGGLGSSVSNAQSTQKTELTAGQGFLASRGNCPTTTTGGTTQTTAGASASSVTSALTSLSANSTCQSSPIKTPGSTIKAALDKSLGSGIDTLVSAHTFDEIISSLLGQLTNQIFSSGGLSGASQPTTTTVPATATTATTTTTVPTYFDQTDPTQTATNASLISNLSSTISSQITQIQQFQNNWTTINNAALAANAALSSTTCYPNAQYVITSTVQPVLQQAATSLSEATTGINGLQSIQQQLTAAQNSTSDPTTALSNVSTAYTNIQSTLPSGSDIAFAIAQSTDTGTSTPASLYTQMVQITAAAQQCSVNGIGT